MIRAIKENRWRGFFMKYIKNWINQSILVLQYSKISIIRFLNSMELLSCYFQMVLVLCLELVNVLYSIRRLVFLSILLLISRPIFADVIVDTVIDNNTGKLTTLRNGLSIDKLRPGYSVSQWDIFKQYPVPSNATRIRSAASGATAVARVPAVVSRTVPAARVASGILGKARYLKAGGLPGLIITTVAPIAIEKLLEDNGYRYDYDQKDFVDIREYKIVIGFNDENSKWHTVAVGGLSKEAVGMGQDYYLPHYVDPLCRAAWNKAKNSPPFKEWGERGYEYSGIDRFSQSCSVLKGEDGRAVLSYEIEENKSHPITEQQFQEIIQPYLEKDPEAWVKAADLPESAWGAPKVLITQETVVNSEPYTDPRDGKAKQSLFRLWPCGNETCASETIKDRPDLKPNSPEAPVATPGGEAGDKTGDKDKTDNQQPPPFDLCKEHPDILACQGMGDVKGNEFDDIKIPRHVNQETWKPDSFLPDNGVCPAPKTFHVLGKEFSVSYEPLCVLMEKVRFIVLIAFILMSAYVAFGGLRKG